MAVLVAFDGVGEGVGGAVAAAEFVVAWGDEGVVVGAGGEGGREVVVQHLSTVGEGLSGEFPALEQQMELKHDFALGYAFS